MNLGLTRTEELSEQSIGRFFGPKEEKRQLPSALPELMNTLAKAAAADLEKLASEEVPVSVADIKEFAGEPSTKGAEENSDLFFGASNEQGSFWCGIMLAPQVAIAFLETVLGSNDSAGHAPIDRELTQAERSMATLLATRISLALTTALQEFGQETIELLPCRLTAPENMPASSSLVEVSLKLTFFEKEADIQVYLVSESLTAMLGQDDPVTEAAPPPNRAWTSHMRGETQQTPIELTAHLNAGTLSLGEINRLKPGQTIPLDATKTSLIEVQCNAVPLMKCKIGRSGESFVLAVEKFLKPGSDAGAKDLAMAFGMMEDAGEADAGPALGSTNNGGGV